jgi:thiol-disulfide isomerase/thioredoxin
MKKILLELVLLLAASFCFPFAGAADSFFKGRSDSSVFSGKRDGFFFYVDPPDPSQPAEAPKGQPLPYSRGKFDGTIDWNAVKKMHPAEMRVLVEDVRDYAIQDPTPERLKAYMTLQAVAMEKATAFQQQWANVLLENPVLNENAKRPATGFVTDMLVKQQVDDREKSIADMKANMGILFFYAPDCHACDEQKKILEMFGKEYGWTHILGVDVSKEPRTAAEYNVQLVPDIWVVGHRDGQILKRRVNAGFSTVSQIERGMVQAYYTWFKGENYTPMPYVPVTDFDTFVKTMPENIR